MPAGPSSPNPHRETDRANRPLTNSTSRSIPFGPTPSRPEKSAPLLDPALPRLCNTGRIAHSLTSSPSRSLTMRRASTTLLMAACGLASLATSLGHPALVAQDVAPLPAGVQAAWDLETAYRETTPTRERICINGLWRWQPADDKHRRGARDRLGLLQGPRLLAGHHRLHAEGLPDGLRPSELEGRAAGRRHRGLVPARDHHARRTGPAAASRSHAEYLNSFADGLRGRHAGRARSASRPARST